MSTFERAPGGTGEVRVLHVTTVAISLRFLDGHSTFMARRGIRLHAVSSPGEELHSFGREQNVSVDAVEMPRRVTPMRDLAAVAGLCRVIRRIRPVIVHAHTPKGGLLGMVAATLLRCPVRIYQMRGLPFMTATGTRRRLLRGTEWVACALAHRVLCNSHSLQEVAVAEGLCPAQKIRVLLGGSGNGVDAEDRFNPDRLEPGTRAAARVRFGIPINDLVVGFVGRIVREKGIVELAAAWTTLREDFPQAHLLFVGFQEDEDPLPERLLNQLRDDPRVHLAGRDWNTPPLYAAMDIVVLPTYREGFPNVPLEAAAMELPVVATRIPGCIDAVADGITGILVPPKNADALARAIAKYLSSEALRSRHGRAGRERVVREFRRSAVMEALCDEYIALLRENSRTGVRLTTREAS